MIVEGEIEKLSRIDLYGIDYTRQREISDQEMKFSNMTFEQWRHEIHRSTVMEFRTMIMAEVVERVEIEHPADWWQHLRQRFFPAWWLKRHPVKMTKHTLCADALYPGLESPKSYMSMYVLPPGAPDRIKRR